MISDNPDMGPGGTLILHMATIFTFVGSFPIGRSGWKPRGLHAYFTNRPITAMSPPATSLDDVSHILSEAFALGATDGLSAALVEAKLLDQLSPSEWITVILAATGGRGRQKNMARRSSMFCVLLSELGRHPPIMRNSIIHKSNQTTPMPLYNEMPLEYNLGRRVNMTLEILNAMSHPPCNCPPDVVSVSAAVCCCFDAAHIANDDKDALYYESSGLNILKGNWRPSLEKRKSDGTREGANGSITKKRIRVKRGGRSAVQIDKNNSLIGGLIPIIWEDEHVLCVSKPAGNVTMFCYVCIPFDSLTMLQSLSMVGQRHASSSCSRNTEQ